MESLLSQLYVLLIFLLSGVFIGVLFDIFRVFRRSFKTPDFITYTQDVLFWILTGIYIIYIILQYGDGKIRIYMIIGLIIGFVLYITIASKYFIKINVKIIDIIKTVISKIISFLLFPIKMIFKVLHKILFKPISFITINIHKILNVNLKKLTKIFKSVKISKKNRKNLKQKKDFTA